MMNNLEYIEQVLTNVSFDRDLFERILIEAIAALDENLLIELQTWCMAEFGSNYAGIIISYTEKNINLTF